MYIVSLLNNNYLLPRNKQYKNGTFYNSYSQYNINIAIFKNGMPNSIMYCYILYLCLYLECIKKKQVEIWAEEGKWHAVELLVFCKFSFSLWSSEISSKL
jgi:Fe2+ transport system protein B